MQKEVLNFQRDEPFKEAFRDAFSLLFELLKFEVEGQENLEFMRRGKPAIIAFFPHCGHPDGPAVRKTVPSDLRKLLFFPAAADYWHQKDLKGRLKAGISSLFLRTFPMHRADFGRSIIKSLDVAEQYLLSGYSIVVSPEGTRSHLSPEERELYTGPAELVLRTGMPIVPIRLHGFEDIMPKGSFLPRAFKGIQRKEVLVSIGEPMFFDAEAIGENRSYKRKIITSQLRERFLEM